MQIAGGAGRLMLRWSVNGTSRLILLQQCERSECRKHEAWADGCVVEVLDSDKVDNVDLVIAALNTRYMKSRLLSKTDTVTAATRGATNAMVECPIVLLGGSDVAKEVATREEIPMVANETDPNMITFFIAFVDLTRPSKLSDSFLDNRSKAGDILHRYGWGMGEGDVMSCVSLSFFFLIVSFSQPPPKKNP